MNNTRSIFTLITAATAACLIATSALAAASTPRIEAGWVRATPPAAPVSMFARACAHTVRTTVLCLGGVCPHFPPPPSSAPCVQASAGSASTGSPGRSLASRPPPSPR